MPEPTLPTAKPDNNRYLEYLDKEMTIMGILSTFSIAVVALVLDRVGSADPKAGSLFSLLWYGRTQPTVAVTNDASSTVAHTVGVNQGASIVIGSFCVVLAALFFYRQRAELARLYGQISLSIESRSGNRRNTDEWYRDADSWSTFILYQLAFTLLVIGFAFYAYAVIAARWQFSLPNAVLWSLPLATIIVQVFRMAIVHRYKYHDDPEGALRKWWLCKRLRPLALRRALRNWYRRKSKDAERKSNYAHRSKSVMSCK